MKTLRTLRPLSSYLLLCAVAPCAFGTTPLSRLDAVNVVWETPGKGMQDSMPLGNGDIGANVWTETNGDLLFYISKTDSWGDNGGLKKIGRVRLALTPSPLTGDAVFKQELNLKNGEILITLAGDNPTSLKLWIDANNPVIELSVKSARPVTATASVELWRTNRITRASQISNPYAAHPENVQPVVEPDTVIPNYPGGIAWYHCNSKSIGPSLSMAFQGLDDYPGFKDTLLHRTFGAVIKGVNAKKIDALTLASSGTAHLFSVHVLTRHPATAEEWTAAIGKSMAATDKADSATRYRRHCDWWNAFWQRSWITVTSTEQKKTAGLAPANKHTLKVGIDQHGGNLLKGEAGRLSIFKRALSKEEIEKLAERQTPLADAAKEAALYSGVPQLQAEIAASVNWTDAAEFTCEMWVKPSRQADGGARLIDKLTPGGSDGLLLDTWPGNSLRLICGDRIIHQKECLPADQWSHVAVVLSGGQQRMALYLNGKLLEEQRMPALLEEGFVVTRAYALQRFINACGARGHFPVKFNGSIFTVDRNNDPDDRLWGQGYWWQNTRLPYLSMTMSGDFELMHSLFRMYADDIFPLCQFRTKKYFGFEGAYFGECMYPWGAIFSETYGWDKPYREREDPLQRSIWHKWEWVSGPELVFMMMDYCDYTGDEQYRAEKAIPIAEAILSFFENYYKTGADNKLIMHPSQASETWIECTNPMPELSGLHAITKRLLRLDEKRTTAQQRARWQAFMNKLPPLPTRDTPDGPALAPATKFAKKINCENPELYAVFPFRQIGVGNDHIEWGINALTHRWDRGAFGWRQDDIFMAYLGLADQARDYLVKRASTYDKNSRFPAFWGPNYDWVPDQDHGGVMMKALQSMLLQADPYSDKLYLLPAWPKAWNADFKLHAPGKTVIEGSVREGKLENLKVTPASRRKDMILKSLTP